MTSIKKPDYTGPEPLFYPEDFGLPENYPGQIIKQGTPEYAEVVRQCASAKEDHAKAVALRAFDEAYLACLAGGYYVSHLGRINQAREWSEYIYEREMEDV